MKREDLSHTGKCTGVGGVQPSSRLAIIFRKIYSTAVLVSCILLLKYYSVVLGLAELDRMSFLHIYSVHELPRIETTHITFLYQISFLPFPVILTEFLKDPRNRCFKYKVCFSRGLTETVLWV